MLARKAARISAEASKCCLGASSEEDMADKIYELLSNDEMRQHVADQGLDYGQQFTWERAVQQTVEVYEELSAGR